MKNIIIGLAYAIGIIITEILVVAAWYCSPLVMDFDASPIILATVILLPVITSCIITRKNQNKLVEKGIAVGIILWCLMLVPICWALPMLISKKLLLMSLFIYVGLSVGSNLCSSNIYNLRAARKSQKKSKETAEA
ncbi:MAG: hypothetical protein ACOX7J_07865 [Bacillota bacterium]|jgi:hypothetical protein